MKVFRSQLPQKNGFYNSSDNLPTENYTQKLKNLQKNAYSFSNLEYIIKTEIVDKEEVQEQIFLSQERVKELLNQPTNEEYEEFEANVQKTQDFKHELELLEQFKISQTKNEEKHEDIEEFIPLKEDFDKEYEKYKYLLDLNDGEEILRYVRGKNTIPLWYSENDQWKNSDVRNCEYCGCKRVFEFQINSTFLNLYKELIEFDWGIIAVYTYFILISLKFI